GEVGGGWGCGEGAGADVDTHDASRCRRGLRGGGGRGGLAFRYRGLLPVQFHEPVRGRAPDRGWSGRLPRARTEARRKGVGRPVPSGGGRKQPVTPGGGMRSVRPRPTLTT